MSTINHIKKKFQALRLQCGMNCHNDSKYDIALFSSVYSIPYEHWNMVLNGENLLLSIPYLAALENDPARKMEFHYAIVYHQNQPQALLYFQEFDFSMKNLNKNVELDKVNDFASLVQRIKNIALKSIEDISLRLLTMGNTYVTGEHGFHKTKDFASEDLGLVIDQTIDKICSLDNKKGHITGLLAKDFYKDNKDEVEYLVKNFHQFKVQPNMILSLDKDWETFDNYLDAMSSKYRVRARSTAKKGEKIEIKELKAEEIAKLNGKILELYNNVESGADFQLTTIGHDYFFNLKAALEDNFKFMAYYIDKQLAGFATAFVWDEYLEAHYVGLDYKWNDEVPIYQNMLYDYVKLGLESKVKEVSFGRTALEIKSTVGAEPREMMLFVKHSNSVSHKLIKPFIENIRQEKWIQRRPFKKKANGDNGMGTNDVATKKEVANS